MLVHIVVKLLFFFVPMFLMTFLVRLLTRFEPTAALTTAKFIKSPHGVRQALYLARDELRKVKEDSWVRQPPLSLLNELRANRPCSEPPGPFHS